MYNNIIVDFNVFSTFYAILSLSFLEFALKQKISLYLCQRLESVNLKIKVY